MNKSKEEIKSKGFDMQIGRDSNEEYIPGRETDYSKIKVGLKQLDNALLDLSFFKKIDSTITKENIATAISNNNYPQLRAYSNYFYKSSGIYARLCRYLAYLYRYDWMVTPIVLNTSIKTDKVIEGFHKSLTYLDNFNVKKNFGEIALKVIRNGAYYAYKVEQSDRMALQELPIDYCRSRYYIGQKPAVEFNMKYFDDNFRDATYRSKVIKMFPAEFAKGYILYKEGKLGVDFMGDTQGWYLLNPKNTVKFNLNGEDYPALVAIIPSIIDLDEAQELDRRKMQQQLLKIIIQKMPMDKNGELIFDVDEAKALHNNAVSMLASAVGVDVLTTFADVDVEDMADRSTTTTIDELRKVERAVFNEAGVSQAQFNTDGNLALEKSIANDEAGMSSLIFQLEIFLNELLAPFNVSPKKLQYKVQLLMTTIYNYKEISKLYKEQLTVGFSKMLPQIALGQSQSTILATAYFENDILDLNELFTPPAMSSTTSGAEVKEKGTPGRPPLPDEKKSDKTIQNEEAMS